jgi:hypothetical protein
MKGHKKSQFGEHFCQNRNVFVGTMSLPTSSNGVHRQESIEREREGSASLAATTLSSQNKKRIVTHVTTWPHG